MGGASPSQLPWPLPTSERDGPPASPPNRDSLGVIPRDTWIGPERNLRFEHANFRFLGLELDFLGNANVVIFADDATMLVRRHGPADWDASLLAWASATLAVHGLGGPGRTPSGGAMALTDLDDVDDEPPPLVDVWDVGPRLALPPRTRRRLTTS